MRKYVLALSALALITFSDAQAESLLKTLMTTELSKDVFAKETADHGVTAPSSAYTGDPGDKTPTTIPGAKVITTGGLLQLIQGFENPAIIDVGRVIKAPSVPYAMFWARVGWGDQEGPAKKILEERMPLIKWATPERPVVFLAGPFKGKDYGWYGYNAALRATQMGYKNIYWYRGGRKAWKTAGLPMMPLVAPGLR